MKAALVLLALTLCSHAQWQSAQPGWRYEFPRDHGVHADFKTEWWYFTGNVRDEAGREFGFQLTFFRQGIQPHVDPAASRFLVRDMKFAHFAISDLRAGRFHFSQKISRGAFGEAGFGPSWRLAWIDDWELVEVGERGFELRGASAGRALKLRLETNKPPVIHGENGVSQKAAGAGHASHYYSFTRLATRGQLTLDGRNFSVTGETWFDHEWATNQLTAEQAGWDWFSLQLGDGTELMLYRMRLKNGAGDPESSGTFIDEKGSATHLRADDFRLTPLAWWKSAATGARYPIRWRVEIPRLRLDLTVAPQLADQELSVRPVAYWEGVITANGTRGQQPVAARGYMELTGYAAALSGLDGSR